MFIAIIYKLAVILERPQNEKKNKWNSRKSICRSKDVFLKKITLKQATEILSQNGMNEKSALDYIYNYANLIQGKLFTRTTNTYGTEYYLKKIYEENGQIGLQNALLSLSQHLDYYEEKSGSSVKKRRNIYNEYLKLLNKKTELTIYADEVDENVKYAEGKTKTVLVNSYERNQIARQKCIEHYGVVCQACNFDFEKIYGDIGKDFIHVHHKVDIATIVNEYSVDPLRDLISARTVIQCYIKRNQHI